MKDREMLKEITKDLYINPNVLAAIERKVNSWTEFNGEMRTSDEGTILHFASGVSIHISNSLENVLKGFTQPPQDGGGENA